MKTTPALLIVTADDFPVGSCVDKECEKLIQEAGCGEHRYGGKHYSGHHVVFKRWHLRQNRVDRFAPSRSAVKANVAINRVVFRGQKA